MTKTCVVCKKYPISGDNTRSFHKFPFNEDTKRQWMEATGISKVTVNCTVCSDHFTPQSYHKTDGFGTVKRLLRNAVPKINSSKYIRDEEVIEESNIEEMENMFEETSDSRECRVRRTLSNSNENPNANVLDDFDDQSCSNDSSANSSDEKNNMDKMSNKLKRKISTTNIRALNIKRMFRFRDGVETKYICREEFVTEEAWNKFLRLMLLNRRRMEGLRQRICRRKKMIEIGLHQKPAKDQEECNPEKFLEIVLKE